MMLKIETQPDVWMGNGIENLYILIDGLDGCSVEIDNTSLNIEILDKEKFLKNFANRIKQKQDEIIFVKKRDDKGQIRYVKKDFVLMQYGKASGDRNVLKEKIYSETEKRLDGIFSNLEKGNKTCVICGKNFKKSVDKLKQAVYPFVTKIKSLSGVRTLKDNYDNICPLCYLVGTLEWLDEGIIYRCFLGGGERTYSVIFLPFEFDLEKLYESKKEYIEILTDRHSQVSNLLKIKKKNIGYEGEFTTILKFFEKFIDKILDEYREEEIELDELFEEVGRKICKSWIIIKVPSGQVKNIRYQHLDLDDEILHLIVEMEKRSNFIYANVIDKIGVEAQGLSLRQKNKIISEKRELMGKYVLKNDFRGFSRVFLPKKNKTVYYGNLDSLNELIKLWRLEKMGLEEHLEDIKSAGNCLAKLLENHLSVLYAMDKARSKDEFVRALEQASKRLVGLKEGEIRGEMKPSSLAKITEMTYNIENWQELRDVLLIYTCIFLSYKKFEKEKGGEE